jgi:hypothetical protein
VKAAVAHSRTGLGEWMVQVEFTEKRQIRNPNIETRNKAGESKNQNAECKMTMQRAKRAARCGMAGFCRPAGAWGEEEEGGMGHAFRGLTPPG